MNDTHTLQKSIAKRVDVFATTNMEERLRSLDVPVTFHFASEVSMETQQMEESVRQDTNVQQVEDLEKLLQSAKPTGTPHLFLLDPEALSVGSANAQSVLKALASTRFSGSNNAVAVMLPPESGYSSAGRAAASLIKQTYLRDTEIPTFESVDELTTYLQGL